MGISTKKGDDGFTSLYRGGRVPKDHLITETNGAVDEAGSQIGLARAASKERKVKRILLQIQQDLFTIGAEISTLKGQGKELRKKISVTHVAWLEKLADEFEEALALPPGFVAFGQKENASHLDVARTSVRRAERLVVKMKSQDHIENPNILKYLNRVSDLIFLMASYEEADATRRDLIRRKLLWSDWREPFYRRWTIMAGSFAGMFLVIIILLLLFHGNPDNENFVRHMKEMESMHHQITSGTAKD